MNEETSTVKESESVSDATAEEKANEASVEEVTDEITEDRAADSDSSILDGDLNELRAEFPELENLTAVTELSNPIRYAALRDLGLSPAEAYLLTSRRHRSFDTRSHLTASVPAAAKSPSSGITAREISAMRELFGDISDSEIHNLYKKVTRQERNYNV